MKGHLAEDRFSSHTGATLHSIQELLLEGIRNPSEGVRFCAAQWAVRLFPFGDVTARYVCILAAADHKLEVREAGLNGMKPAVVQSRHAGAFLPSSSFFAFETDCIVGSVTLLHSLAMTCMQCFSKPIASPTPEWVAKAEAVPKKSCKDKDWLLDDA